jgi:hypothetical protein
MRGTAPAQILEAVDLGLPRVGGMFTASATIIMPNEPP